MGWTEGEGLGKHEDGMKACIQITRREEGTGLGNENTTPAATFKWNDQFWTNMYNSNASKFAGIKGEGASLIKDNSSSSSSSEESSSDDGPALTDRYGRRPTTKKSSSKKKVEKKVTPETSSDSDSDISEIEIVKAEKSYFVAVKESSKSIKKDKDSKKDKKKSKKSSKK